MDTTSNIKKNVLYNTLLSVSQFLFPLVTFPYVSRVLGPKGIGSVSFVDSLTQYFILVAALGIPVYGIREIAKHRNDRDSISKLYAELVGIHFVITAILAVVYIALFNILPRLRTESSLFWIGTCMLVVNIFPTEWFFQGIEKFSFVVSRTLIIRILSITLLFIFVRSSKDTIWYYAINLITLVFNAVVNLSFVLRNVKIRFTGLQFRPHLKPLLLIFSSSVAISIYTLMDSILLGFIGTNDEVGYYATCVRLNKVIVSLIAAFSLVMVPRLSFAFKEQDNKAIDALLEDSFNYIIFITIPISIGLFVLAPDIIELFAGKAFAPAVTVVRIMSPLIFLVGLSNIFGMQILIPVGKESLLLKSVTVGMVVSISLNLILIPLYRHNGAAITNIITEIFVTTLTGYFAIKQFRFTFKYRIVWQALIASALFFPISYLFSRYSANNYVKLFGVFILSSITYLSIQYWIFNSPMIVKLLGIAKGFIRKKI